MRISVFWLGNNIPVVRILGDPLVGGSRDVPLSFGRCWNFGGPFFFLAVSMAVTGTYKEMNCARCRSGMAVPVGTCQPQNKHGQTKESDQVIVDKS